MEQFNGVKSKVTRYVGSLFDFLENPEHPLLGPHRLYLGFTGQFHPNRELNLVRFKRAIIYLTVFFFFTQYFKCCLSVKLSSALLILQYAPFHMGIVKICFFEKHYDKWTEIINYVSTTECTQKVENDPEVLDTMAKYIKHSRRANLFFCVLAFLSNFIIFSEPYQKNHQVENSTDVYVKIFNFYTPFNQEVPPGYYVSMAIQTILGHAASAYVVAWDVLVQATMIFFSGQLKISRIYCTKIIKDCNVEQSHRNIVKCHRFHMSLINHQKFFNSLISPVMFVYLAVVSVNLGVCIIQISKLKGDLAVLVASVVYIIGCLSQLLLFYWYGNELIKESELVSYGIFESNWVNMNVKVLREAALLQVSTSKRLFFRAGPFNEMSLTTFVAILRLSYSFYTLLNETK